MIAEMDTITIAEEHRELPGDAVASPFQRPLAGVPQCSQAAALPLAAYTLA